MPRDLASLMCHRSESKMVQLGIDRTQIRPRLYQVSDVQSINMKRDAGNEGGRQGLGVVNMKIRRCYPRTNIQNIQNNPP